MRFLQGLPNNMSLLLSLKMLLLLTTFSATCIKTGKASVFTCESFQYLCDVVEDVTGYSFETEVEEEEETHFYQEDMIATAAMMVDFVDTPLYLVAVFKYRETAVYEDGRSTNLTGFDADKIYTKVILSEILPAVGGELVFIANIEGTTATTINVDDGNEQQLQDWDALAVLSFPNSIAFGRMAAHPKFGELTVHKKAGLADTLVFACEAMPGTSMDALGPNDTAAVMYSTEKNDAPMAMVNLLDYRRYARYQEGDADAARWRSGSNAMQKYDDIASPLAISQGMRTGMFFKVKHSLISGASGWDEVRINTFPSHAALVAVSNFPELQTAMPHFVAGVKRVSAFQVSPMFVNSLGGNGQVGYYEACASVPTMETESTLEVDTSSYCPS